MSSSMYSEHAERYDLVIRKNAYNTHYERPSLLALLPELAGKKVLDLGCGPGVYAELLVAKGAIVTAVDASSEMVRITQEKLGPKSDCYVQDLLLGLPKEDGDSYDIVMPH